MARKTAVVWAAEDTAASLHAQYRAEPEPEVRTRLHALWRLRLGVGPAVAAAVVGVAGEPEGRGDGPHLGGLEDPAIDGWVWDGVGGHQGEEMQAVDAPRVVQPPYAPELNPVERFFRELRRAIEGRYPTLQAKQEALEPVLNAWQADPERVRRLCGWKWIRKALKNLSDDTPASPSGPLA